MKKKKGRNRIDGKTSTMNVSRLRKLLKEKAVSSGQLFHYMDNNRDNQVSLVEFKYGLSLAGVRASYEEVLKLFSDCDADADGRITWKEFVHTIFSDSPDTPTSPFSPSNVKRSPAKISKSTSWQTLERLRKEAPEVLSKTRDLRRLDDIAKVLKGFCRNKRLLYGTVVQCALDMFGVADRDANGYLDEKEFRDAMNRLGLGLSKEESKGLFDLIDEDGSGQIDFHEFHAALRKRHYDRGEITHHASTGDHDISKNKGNGYRKQGKKHVPHYMLATENWTKEHEGRISPSAPKQEEEEEEEFKPSELLDAVRVALNEGSGMKEMRKRVSKMRSVNKREMRSVLDDLGFQFSASQLAAFMENFSGADSISDVIRIFRGGNVEEEEEEEEDVLDLKAFVKDLAREVRTLKRAVDRLSSAERGQSSSSRSARKINSGRRGYSSGKRRSGSGSSSRRHSRSALRNYNVELITNPPVTRTEKRTAETKKLRSFLFREREFNL